MRKPIHPTVARRGLLVFCLVALSLFAGCGKLRGWFAPKEPENPHFVTITWNASIPPIEGYNVYRESPSGGIVKLTTRIVAGTQYTDRTVEAGHVYWYYVTSVDSKGMESTPSGKITVTVPTTVPPPGKQ